MGGGVKEEERGDGLLVVVVYGEVLEMGRYDWRTVFWWEWPATWAPARSPSCRPERLGEEKEGRVERRGEWGGGKRGMLTTPAVLQGRWSAIMLVPRHVALTL